MEVFIKKNPPIYTWRPTPVFRTTLEKQKYWAQQKKYWLEGWNHLPGTLYHYLQEQKIKDRVSGKTIRPIPRESDLWIHEEVRNCRTLKCPSAMIKTRGIGLSSLGGSLINYFMRTYPGSTSLVTSADQPRISKLYTDKIKVTHENYNPDIKYEISKLNEAQLKTYLQLEVKHLDDTGQETISYSDIFCNQTSASDDAAASFSGTGAIFGFYDELPLNKRRKKLLQSSVECYRNQLTGEVDGFLLTGGTCEDILTNEELLEFQKLVLDAAAYNMRVFFIPYWWRFMDENGNVDRKKGEEWYKKERDRFENLEDQSHLRAFMKNNPGSLADIFDLAKGGLFEDDVADKIEQQHKIIISLKDEPLEVPHKLVEMNGEVEFVPDKNGVIFIKEKPKEGVQYYEVIDGVATGSKAGNEEGSNVAGLIMKMFDPSGYSYSPVALYYERPKVIEQSYFKLTTLAKGYDRFGGLKGIMAEANAGTADHFSTHLEKLGMGKYIMNRKDLSGKGNSNTKKNFQYVTIDVRDWQIRQANIFLRKYIASIRMKRVLEDLLKGSMENADIRDAFLMFFVAAGANFDKQVTKEIAKPREIVTLENHNGRNVWVKKTVGQSNYKRGVI